MAVTGSPTPKNFYGTPIRKRRGDKARFGRQTKLNRTKAEHVRQRNCTFEVLPTTHEVRVDMPREAPRTITLPDVQVTGGEWNTSDRCRSVNQERSEIVSGYGASFSVPAFASEIVSKRDAARQTRGKAKAERIAQAKARAKARKSKKRVQKNNLHTINPSASAPIDGCIEVLSENEWVLIQLNRVSDKKGPSPYIALAKQGRHIKTIHIREARSRIEALAQLQAVHNICRA